MEREHFEVKETAVSIIAEKEFIKVAKDAIFEARRIIESKISGDPFFGITYDPYPIRSSDEALIQRMCKASVVADVGPMAAVAGAVAAYAVEAMVSCGSTYAVVENGGDISFINDRPLVIGLYAGDPGFDGISLKMHPSEKIRGVCSSSGKIGPSVSFGDSSVSTVLSDDAILADACATALGNSIKDVSDLSPALEKIGSICGVSGCIACHCGKIAFFGDIPELVHGRMENGLITTLRS
ncbi:MAG: UPF0280 family protein [Candidatus Methanoplasma sp.]|jgi:ApbE superfamily uncharacterized protein (UPF0280 family)|nr:UPF0280 family protein [Candidatus Methanoplasma sp.]